MHMHIEKKFLLIKNTAITFMVVSVIGCAFGHYGQANTGYFDIVIPQIENGATKLEIIKSFGVPNSSVSFNDTDYWRYRNVSGWFMFLGGVTKEKDLVIEFKADKAISSYILDKGKSMGILMLQGAVSN